MRVGINFISGKTEAKKHRNRVRDYNIMTGIIKKELEKNQKIEEFHIFSLYKC